LSEREQPIVKSPWPFANLSVPRGADALPDERRFVLQIRRTNWWHWRPSIRVPVIYECPEFIARPAPVLVTTPTVPRRSPCSRWGIYVVRILTWSQTPPTSGRNSRPVRTRHQPQNAKALGLTIPPLPASPRRRVDRIAPGTSGLGTVSKTSRQCPIFGPLSRGKKKKADVSAGYLVSVPKLVSSGMVASCCRSNISVFAPSFVGGALLVRPWLPFPHTPRLMRTDRLDSQTQSGLRTNFTLFRATRHLQPSESFLSLIGCESPNPSHLLRRPLN